MVPPGVVRSLVLIKACPGFPGPGEAGGGAEVAPNHSEFDDPGRGAGRRKDRTEVMSGAGGARGPGRAGRTDVESRGCRMMTIALFERLIETAGLIARHPDYPGK